MINRLQQNRKASKVLESSLLFLQKSVIKSSKIQRFVLLSVQRFVPFQILAGSVAQKPYSPMSNYSETAAPFLSSPTGMRAEEIQSSDQHPSQPSSEPHQISASPSIERSISCRSRKGTLRSPSDDGRSIRLLPISQLCMPEISLHSSLWTILPFALDPTGRAHFLLVMARFLMAL